MKKLILVAMIVTLCNILYSQDDKAAIEKLLNTNLEKLSNTEIVVPNKFGVEYKNAIIDLITIKYNDNYGDDYWTPDDFNKLYKTLKETNTYHYYSSIDEIIEHLLDKYYVDSFTFTLFEVNDMRLVRILCIFDYNKATVIIVTANIDNNIINNDLERIGYRYYKQNEGWYWKNNLKTEIEFGENIRNGKIEIEYIKSWYSISETIKESFFKI